MQVRGEGLMHPRHRGDAFPQSEQDDAEPFLSTGPRCQLPARDVKPSDRKPNAFLRKRVCASSQAGSQSDRPRVMELKKIEREVTHGCGPNISPNDDY